MFFSICWLYCSATSAAGISSSAAFQQIHLHQSNYTVINNTHKLRSNVFFYLLHAFFLNRADALCFDKDLIGNRGQAQNAPGSTVIICFFNKDIFTSIYNPIIFLQRLINQLFGVILEEIVNRYPDLKAKDTFFYKKSTLNCHGKILSLATPLVMGILNVTPDSFYAGSRSYRLPRALLAQAETMLAEGAKILDIGGYSTRPGATDVSLAEEKARVLPAIKAIRKAFPDGLISVDTFRAEVAEAAVHAGANIINDVSGGTLDENMFANSRPLTSSLYFNAHAGYAANHEPA